ncbi:hypothetical protein [Azospirillum canadense]|uniref:hypothetical protein n=1 Tax=Azospirillum canadense TaxID=403962 RepID=UPI002226031E|nr:hypothetical protein [Azospirillum canadense]MCW2243592.1 hypothetical protein [Azospirillum canadense]
MSNDDDTDDDDNFIVMVWHRREDWPEIKQRFVDGNKLPETYDEWLRRSEATASAAASQGFTVIRVLIMPDEFAIWCARRYLDMDAEARIAFTSEAAFRMLFGGRR